MRIATILVLISHIQLENVYKVLMMAPVAGKQHE